MIVLLSVIVAIVVFLAVFFNTAPQIGEEMNEESEGRAKKLSYYKEGKFNNLVPTDMSMSASQVFSLLGEYMKSNTGREPKDTLMSYPVNTNNFKKQPEEEIQIHWLGHSTLLIQIDDQTILTDPVFGKRASMFSFLGPANFPYTTMFSANTIPEVDAVIISHDHYDHLDYTSIVALKDKVKRFIVPLGIRAHLEKWGVKPEQITELEWWQATELNGVKLTCTPTRHFSGRGLTNRFSTLWCSWVIEGENQKAFFGGDSGYFDGFKTIGDKFGPFDVTMLECGAYNERWANIHMMPEETAQAHLDLKGRFLMPIHWGKFNLSLHPWKEPVVRLEKESKKLGIAVATPEIGAKTSIPKIVSDKNWWQNYN